jgi:hypothetical protein
MGKIETERKEREEGKGKRERKEVIGITREI